MENKKKKLVICILVILLLLLGFILGYKIYLDNSTKILYRVYTKENKWSKWKTNGEIAGKENNDIKGIQIKFKNNKNKSVFYNVSYENIVFEEENIKSDGETIGDLKKSIYDIKIGISGKIAKNYKIYYRTHSQLTKWTDWTEGFIGLSGNVDSAMDQIQIKIVDKDKSFDLASKN